MVVLFFFHVKRVQGNVALVDNIGSAFFFFFYERVKMK